MNSVDTDVQESSDFWSKSLGEELLRFLGGRTRCPELAADLTQEVYLGLRRSSERAAPENLRALAFRIAINLLVDHQRKLAVRSKVMADTDMEQVEATVSAHAQEPERILIGRERMKQLREALDALPVDCRTAFLLHSVDGLSYSQIATRLGVSVSQVNKLLARALAFCTQRVDG